MTIVVKEKPSGLKELSVEQRKEIAAWFEANHEHLPEAVRIFLSFHQKYIAADSADVRKSFDSTWRELRRALGITPSSEKRPSGSALAGLPREKEDGIKGKREKLEERIERTQRLGNWYDKLSERHKCTNKRLLEKLANMPKEPIEKNAVQEIPKDIPVEEIPLTEEKEAQAATRGMELAEHMTRGDGADPAFQSVNETLMPGGAVLSSEKYVTLAATIPEDLANAKVVKEMNESRVRYDFEVSVTRIELDVEKKVVKDKDGERYVFTASTSDYGPPGYSVTWSALATLAVMVGRFAIPLNRLGTMLSTAGKRFTASALSRMLHYVAERLIPIYLELATQLANCEILAGDDTSCRVLEVSGYFEKKTPESKEENLPPWKDYKTPTAAEKSFHRCMEKKRERIQRREDGDRKAKRRTRRRRSECLLVRNSFSSPLVVMVMDPNSR